MPENPIVHVIAGPNGAGKTTFAREFLPQFARCDEFVNADLLAQGLSPFAPERAAFRAGRLMLQRIEELCRQHVSFGFETTLAGRGHLALLQRIRSRGYAIHLYFLWLPSADMAVERVAHRVRHGGHHVEESVVRRRYGPGIKNLFREYRSLLARWILFDNSGLEPRVVAREIAGKLEIVDEALFTAIMSNLSK